MLAYSEEKSAIPTPTSGLPTAGRHAARGPDKNAPCAVVDAAEGVVRGVCRRQGDDSWLSVTFQGLRRYRPEGARHPRETSGDMRLATGETSVGLERQARRRVAAGGRPAVQLELDFGAWPIASPLSRALGIRHLTSCPSPAGGIGEYGYGPSCSSCLPVAIAVGNDQAIGMFQYWLTRCNSGPTQGLLSKPGNLVVSSGD